MGYFRHRPAVRHKEILWAMSEGIHLFGAASIGALRAAELRDFGMIGVGQIFWEYAEGRLEDDDEVAVDYGPQELGYPPLNETLVDIRATLEHARQQGVIGRDSQLSLIAIAKQSFYPKRQYAELISLARQQGSDSTELDRLRAWLPGGKVSRKREDALAMLGEIRDFLKSGPPSLKVTYHFERTEMWEADIKFAAPLVTTTETADLPRRNHLLDEIRLGSIDLVRSAKPGSLPRFVEARS